MPVSTLKTATWSSCSRTMRRFHTRTSLTWKSTGKMACASLRSRPVLCRSRNCMFGKEAFKVGLEELGHTVEDRGENRLAFKYRIGGGRFKDREISIGVEVPPDFNVTCPTGPHLSPRLIPINPNGAGNDRATESPN